MEEETVSEIDCNLEDKSSGVWEAGPGTPELRTKAASRRGISEFRGPAAQAHASGQESRGGKGA